MASMTTDDSNRPTPDVATPDGRARLKEVCRVIRSRADRGEHITGRENDYVLDKYFAGMNVIDRQAAELASKEQEIQRLYSLQKQLQGELAALQTEYRLCAEHGGNAVMPQPSCCPRCVERLRARLHDLEAHLPFPTVVQENAALNENRRAMEQRIGQLEQAVKDRDEALEWVARRHLCLVWSPGKSCTRYMIVAPEFNLETVELLANEGSPLAAIQDAMDEETREKGATNG